MKGARPLLPMGWAYPLEPREPAAGFGSRLAALNGRSLREFLREMEIPPRSLDKGEEQAVRALATLGRADDDVLLRFTPVPLGTKFYAVAGEKLGRLAINRTYFRFCPRCVEEDLAAYDGPPSTRPWLRLEWTISHFRSCQSHGIFLETTRPVRRRFEPFDFTETMTELLPEMAARSSSARQAPPSPFQSWIGDRLEGQRNEANWLDDLYLYVAAGFCEALGISSLHEPKVKTARLTVEDWAAAADEGFRIASAGEDSLRHLLQRLTDAQSSTRGFWGPRDTYGYVYGLLQNTVDDPAFEKLREAVRRFALESMPIEPGTDVLGEKAGERRIHTIRTASRDSGVHARTIRQLFQRMGLADDREGSGLMDHRVLVDSEKVQRLVSELKRALTAPQVEELLGVPRTHLRELVSSGHLPALAGTGERAYAKRRFSREDAEKLRTRLFEGASEVENPAPRQMNIVDVRRAATCSVSDLLDMIFTGKLGWKGQLAGRTDYMALLLDADEVTRQVRSGETKRGLTQKETMAYIPGMGRDSVKVLLDSGHLQTTEEFNPEARRMSTVVSRESADAFRESYVSLGELVQDHGLHHKRVRLLLRSVNIEAILDPDEVGTYFYSRADVLQAQREDPDFWEYDKASAQRKAKRRAGKR